MLAQLCKSQMFAGLQIEEIEAFLKDSGAKFVEYKKNDIIFHQYDKPDTLMMLVKGSVLISNDSSSGRRSIVAKFTNAGELFGEVFVFLHTKGFDHYAQAGTDSTVLQISRDFIYSSAKENIACHDKIVANILSILAHKAYYLNKRLQIMACATLRQKITKVLLQNLAADKSVNLSMNREAMADFLNVARPSLSRELMKMQDDGLLHIEKKKIYIDKLEELEEIL